MKDMSAGRSDFQINTNTKYEMEGVFPVCGISKKKFSVIFLDFLVNFVLHFLVLIFYELQYTQFAGSLG